MLTVLLLEVNVASQLELARQAARIAVDSLAVVTRAISGLAGRAARLGHAGGTGGALARREIVGPI